MVENKHKIAGILLFGIVIFTSCREVYFPDDISSLERIPVFRGMICEGFSPEVHISYAMGYYENAEVPVENATVFITDNIGNQVELLEESAGLYKPASGEFKGVSGRTYTLHVNTPDGNEYESTPEKINEKPAIDSIYAYAGELEMIKYNTYGEPVIQKIKEGLHVYSDLSAETNSTIYYRFNTLLVRQYSYLVPAMTGDVVVYRWENPVVIGDFYSVDYTVVNSGRQILPEHKIGYIEWLFLEDLPSEAHSLMTHHVLIIKVFSISNSVYDYYHSIDQQLNSANQMLAPVPSQIETNIRCVNDPARIVSGVFEASSVAAGYNAYLYLDNDMFRAKTLTEFPDSLEAGTYGPDPPDFWVTY